MKRKAATAMAVPGLKVVSKRLADGSVKQFYYHRATKLALGSERTRAIARIAEIDALNGPPDRSRMTGTIAALTARYKASPEFTALAQSTQILWRPFLTDLEERAGDWAPQMFTLALASKFKATLIAKHGSGSARNRFKCFSRLWGWGLSNGLVETANPFGKPGSFAKPGAKKKSKPIWRLEQVKKFLSTKRVVDAGGNPALLKGKVTRAETVPDDVRMALLLGLLTMQRQGDVLSMTGKNIKVGKKGKWWFSLVQQKTDTLVEFPVHSRLREEIERQDIKPGADTPLVATKSGKHFDKRNFARKFDTWLEAAKLGEFDFRALRRSGMVLLAEEGESAFRIAAVSGHSIDATTRILEYYIPKTRKLAEGAIDAYERVTKDVFPSGL